MKKLFLNIKLYISYLYDQYLLAQLPKCRWWLDWWGVSSLKWHITVRYMCCTP